MLRSCVCRWRSSGSSWLLLLRQRGVYLCFIVLRVGG
jgi:hypothetical protein